MEKKTLYALATFAILVVLAIFGLRTPERGDRTGAKPRPVAEMKADKIAALELTQPGGKDTVTIAKQGEKWQVTAPYNKPADQSAVKSAVEQLEKLRWGDITTQQKDRHGELEVSDDKAVHVVAKDSAGQTLCDLFIGKSSGSATMVRVAGKDDVWQAMDLTPFVFRKEGKLWRDHVVFDQKADEAEKLTLVGGGTSVSLERLPAAKGADGKGNDSIYDAKWKVVPGDGKGLQPDPKLVVDDGLVNGVVQTVAGLHAGEFLDSGKPEEVGLGPNDKPLLVQVSFKGGKSIGLKIGALKGEDYHAQSADAPQLFTVKKYTIERAAHLPQDIRDKTLTQLKEEDLTEITIQQGTDTVLLKRADKAWKADKIADYDEAKGKTVAESFATLSGSGFVAPGAPELASLQKPKGMVTLKPKAGAAVVLKIGDAKGDDVIVQKAGQDAMWVKKYNIDRFLKKPAELAKEKDKK